MRQPDNLPAFCRVHRNGRPLIGMSERPIPLSAVWSYAQITLIRAARSAAAARWDLRQIGGSVRFAQSRTDHLA
jgi:hypothetical protein